MNKEPVISSTNPDSSLGGRTPQNIPRKRVILMKTSKLIALLLVVLLVIAVVAYAQAPQRPKGQRAALGAANQADMMTPEQRRAHAAAMAPLQRILMPPNPKEFMRFGIALNLTEEQKAQVKALYQTFGNTLKTIGPPRGEALKGVLNGLQQPTPNKGDLQAGAAKVLDADKAIIDAEFDFWIGLKGILNAQQQTAAQTYLQNKAMGELGGGPRGPGGRQ